MAAALASMLIAGLFAVLVPRRGDVAASRGWRWVVLRWGHTIAWLALAASFGLRSLAAPDASADLLALAGGASWLAYLGLLMATPRRA